MIGLILAAGYATRLYPLTENFPKPLLEVKGKPILDWLTDDLAGAVASFVVISNHRFAGHFERWAAEKSREIGVPIAVVDDGTSANETRLGAVRDIQFAVDSLHIDDDLLVVAGDNVLDFSLRAFVDYAREKGATCVMRYEEANPARLKKAGVAQVDADGRILSMEEKPAEPKSRWCIPPFYHYAKADVPRVREGIEAGCGVDAPGSFIAWLCTRAPVYAMVMPGRRYDIGNLESYEQVQKDYPGIRN